VTPSGEHYDYLTNVLVIRSMFCVVKCSPTGVTPSGEHCCR